MKGLFWTNFHHRILTKSVGTGIFNTHHRYPKKGVTRKERSKFSYSIILGRSLYGLCECCIVWVSNKGYGNQSCSEFLLHRRVDVAGASFEWFSKISKSLANMYVHHGYYIIGQRDRWTDERTGMFETN